MRRPVASLLAAAALLLQPSCATMLHPERAGQPRGGPIDVLPAVLDTTLLCLIFVPGVIAFGIDIYNGTLFLPPPVNDKGPGVVVPPGPSPSS